MVSEMTSILSKTILPFMIAVSREMSDVQEFGILMLKNHHIKLILVKMGG